MKLILIRHGETDYTRQKRYCGSAINAPLNNVGIKQIQKLKQLLQKKRVDVVYTSPLIRTIQTTNIIFENRPVRIYKTPLLRESNLGEWEGHTLTEIKKLFPEDVNKWYEDPLRYGATNGETPIILQRRVRRFLNRLLNTYKNNKRIKTIAIVTHSGPFRIIMGEVSGNGLKDFWKLEPKTGECKEVKLCLRN
ncbi:MAG: histidine phosphatase family protein [Planctomycetota bacterium]